MEIGQREREIRGEKGRERESEEEIQEGREEEATGKDGFQQLAVQVEATSKRGMGEESMSLKEKINK